MVNNKVVVTLSHKDYILLYKSLKDLRDTALGGAALYADKRIYDDEFVRSRFWESYHQYEEIQRLLLEFGLDTQLDYEDTQLLNVCKRFLEKAIAADVNKYKEEEK